jgi:predicted permease
MSQFVLTVLGKVFILFLMIAVGYICAKWNLVSENGAKEMSSVLFYVVTPCLIVSSLQSAIGEVSLLNLAVSGVLSAVSFGIFIAISFLLFRGEGPERRNLLRFASVYSNCGFIGLPLVQGLIGEKGVAYASVYIAVFNLFVWTHGLAMMGGGKGKGRWKKLVLNPGIIGLAFGISLYTFSVRLPGIFLEPISFFSSLNTPLAMIVIGVYIARVPFRSMFGDRCLYRLSVYRLLLLPAVCFAIFLLFHVDRTVFLSMLILNAAPAGANTVMFAAQFGGDTKLASRAVAVTTLFSMLTLPVFPVLANLLYR